MLRAEERHGFIHKIEIIKTEGIALQVFRNEESRIDLANQLHAQGGFHAVFLLADHLGDAVNDLASGAYPGDIDRFIHEAEAPEGKLLHVDGKLAILIIHNDEICAADARVFKARAFKRAAIAIDDAIADLHEIARLMARTERIIIRAELFQLVLGKGTKIRINASAKITVSANEVDPRGIVHRFFIERAFVHFFAHEGPAVHRYVKLLEIEARKRVLRENVYVGGKATRSIDRIVLIIIRAAGRDDKHRFRAIAEFADQNLCRGIGGILIIEKITADQHDVDAAISDVLHHAHEGGTQLSAPLVTLLRR